MQRDCGLLAMQDKSKPYEFRYLLAEVGRERVVLEDNRRGDA
jgi:hypothetical protein